MIKPCVMCGKEFKARNNARCCGRECSRSFRNKRQTERREQCRDSTNTKQRERYWEHVEQSREQQRQYHATHREKSAEWGRKWKVTHPEKVREKHRRYGKAHPEKAREAHRRYRTSDRGRLSSVMTTHNRRVRLSGIPMTADTVFELKAEYGGICPYCNKRITKGHVDHIVPVCKGGINGRNNLVWVCEKCNQQKGNMNLLAFLLHRKNLAETTIL